MHLSHAHTPSRLQLNSQGRLRHFLTTEGLSREQLTEVLDFAESFLDSNGIRLIYGRCLRVINKKL